MSYTKLGAAVLQIIHIHVHILWFSSQLIIYTGVDYTLELNHIYLHVLHSF